MDLSEFGRRKPGEEQQSQKIDLSEFGRRKPEQVVPATSQPSPEKKDVAFKDLYSNDQYYQVVKDYMNAAGYPVSDKDDREEVVKNFMSKNRNVDFNTVLGAVPFLNRIRNASPEQAKKLAEGRKLFGETASMFQKEGQGGVRPYVDVIKSLVTDPSTWLGFGVGKVATGMGARAAVKTAADVAAKKAVGEGLTEAATQAATKQATEEAVKRFTTKAAIAGGATEAVVAGAGNIVDQRNRQEVQRITGQPVEDLSALEFGAAMLIGGGFGYVSGKAAANEKVLLEKQNAYKEWLANRAETPADKTPIETKAVVEPFVADIDKAVKEYTEQHGDEVLSMLGDSTLLTDPQIKTSLSEGAVKSVLKAMELDPSLRPKGDESISDAVRRVFSNLEDITPDTLAQAMRDAGIEPEQFAAAHRTSVADAARMMQQLSVVKRMLNKWAVANNKQDVLAGMYQKADEFHEGINVLKGDSLDAKVMRESKAWITSGIDTTFRNIAGTGIAITIDSASRLIGGMSYATMKAARATIRGEFSADTIKKSYADAWNDATNIYGYLRQSGVAVDVTDELLAGNSRLHERLINSLQEDDKDISKLARHFQSLNNLQDGYFRRAFFASSVERQLREVGVDMKDVLARGAKIDQKILSRAVDDAMKATFSYNPKTYGTSAVERGAGHIISAIEHTPVVNVVAGLAIPFPRFVANALAFQWNYSGVGGLYNMASEARKAVRASKVGAEDIAEHHARQAALRAGQAAVGFGALTAAYKYREANPDTEWYNYQSKDGSTIDVRAIFPLAPYLAVAEYLRDVKGKDPGASKEMLQTIAGMKLPAGSQNTIIDSIVKATQSEDAEIKFWEEIGKITGDFAGRFTQPFVTKQVYDLFDLFREDGTIARDPNQVEGFMEAFGSRVASKLPVAKEELPPAAVRFKETDEQYREGEFFNRLFGFRMTAPDNDVERELNDLSLDPYKVFVANTGDKKIDAELIRRANPIILERARDYFNTKHYKSLSREEQRTGTQTLIRGIVSDVKKDVLGDLEATDKVAFLRQQFRALPEQERKIINQAYAKDHGGKTLEEMKDWEQFMKYKDAIAKAKAIP